MSLITALQDSSPEIIKPPSAAEIARQVEWEMIGVRRGQRAYEMAQKAATEGGRFAETSAGLKIVRGILDKLIPHLEAELDRLVGAIGAAGRPDLHSEPLLAFVGRAESLAYIAASCVVGEVVRAVSFEFPVLAQQICRTMRAQAAYDAFKADLKTQAQAKDERARKLLEDMKRQLPSPNTRQWRAWAKKADVVARMEWSPSASLAAAVFLIDAVCVASEGAILTRPSSEALEEGRSFPSICVVGTSEFIAKIRGCEETCALRSAFRLPMVIPPNDWIFEEEALVQ